MKEYKACLNFKQDQGIENLKTYPAQIVKALIYYSKPVSKKTMIMRH